MTTDPEATTGSPTTPPDAAPLAAPGAGKAPVRRVLVHHTDASQRRLLVASLRGPGIEGAEAIDLDDLEARLGHEPVHALVLATGEGPGGAVFAFLDRLRARPDGIRFLGVALLLARPLAVTERAHLQTGRVRVLLEPLRVSELRRAAQELVEVGS